MSLSGVIASFATGTYTVKRKPVGAYTLGRYTAGTEVTLTIEASVQPLSGKDLQVLPEGQHADATKVVYTTTLLRTRAPAGEPDRVVIDGEDWEVFKVEQWEAFGGGSGGDHFRVFVSRLETP